MCETNIEKAEKEYEKITKRIGNTDYVVGIRFREDATETMNEKVSRLIKKDIDGRAGGEFYG